MRISGNSPEGLFRCLDRCHCQAINAALTREGVGELGQPMLLIALARNGKDGIMASQKELADQLQVSPATITVSLRSLQRLGYVTRLVDENDMRRKPVALTEKGKAALEKIDNAFESVDRGMYRGFSAEERDDISEYFKRMIANLRSCTD